MNRTAQPGDLVELKNKEGGFTDPDTLFDISCDQQKPLGDSIGERTHLAIQSGGLIIVGSVKKADDEAEADAKTKAEADAKAKAEADAKAKAEADAKAKAEAGK